MKIVTRRLVSFLLPVFILCGPALAETSLTMQADTPEVSIESRSSGRNALHLPALQYAFTFEASCGDDLQPVSLQLSVADTRKTLRTEQIVADSLTMTSLSIPANQIAPVVINNFCQRVDAQVSDVQTQSEPSRISIPAALSAQASLRCASETDEHTVYVSSPLNVMLACDIPAESSQAR
jgi:hypothetical protein